MRTTLTLDSDVAARIERERRKRGIPLKDIVNQALRAGLDNLDAHARRQEAFRTEGFSLGHSRVGSLDDIEEVVSRAEGEHHQ